MYSSGGGEVKFVEKKYTDTHTQTAVAPVAVAAVAVARYTVGYIR